MADYVIDFRQWYDNQQRRQAIDRKIEELQAEAKELERKSKDIEKKYDFDKEQRSYPHVQVSESVMVRLSAGRFYVEKLVPIQPARALLVKSDEK